MSQCNTTQFQLQHQNHNCSVLLSDLVRVVNHNNLTFCLGKLEKLPAKKLLRTLIRILIKIINRERIAVRIFNQHSLKRKFM